jgi:hypothetical protein
MSFTSTFSLTESFTLTHAKELSSRVAADLRLCAIYYERPSAPDIEQYTEELTQLLRYGYVDRYEFGFKRDGSRVVSWRYAVTQSGILEGGGPGRIYARAEVATAAFFNYLWRSAKWWALSAEERARFEQGLPVQRTGSEPPSDGKGYWTSDRTYSAGGVSIARETFRPH